jgi:cytoskeletal protein CcmA (bactofilin family)
MFGKSKSKRARQLAAAEHEERLADEREMITQIISEPQAAKGLTLERSAVSGAPEAGSSIASGLSIVGKIVGEGTLSIFGHVQGEVQASTVQIGDGAQVEGNIVAEELTIGGRVKGVIRANSVKLKSTAVVDGDIYHRSLSVEENAQFEGMSRRQENVVDTPSHNSAKRSLAPAIGEDGQRSSSSDTKTAPIDHTSSSNGRLNLSNP